MAEIKQMSEVPTESDMTEIIFREIDGFPSGLI